LSQASYIGERDEEVEAPAVSGKVRRAQALINLGAKPLSLFGMPVTPWRKGKRYSIKPVGVIEPHPIKGDDKGGLKTKKNRFKTGPPGSANGICIELRHPGECRCGKYQNGRHGQ